jgi:hypothetical protein
MVYPEQMARYKQFEKEEKFPVYLVIGLGGIPDNPDQMFLVPLKNVNSQTLSLDFLAKYEVNIKNNFMWRPGSFWNSGYLYQSSD